jgi:hypothetical protein
VAATAAGSEASENDETNEATGQSAFLVAAAVAVAVPRASTAALLAPLHPPPGDARSNSPAETAYCCQGLDASGQPLTGTSAYTVSARTPGAVLALPARLLAPASDRGRYPDPPPVQPAT